jgi:imidazolonepropionase
METTLLTNIKQLFQVRKATSEPLRGQEITTVPSIKDAFLLIEDGNIKSFGEMSDLNDLVADESVDCSKYVITPGYVDSHTHLVFAATRENEFEQRIKGLTYEEIAARGGGIINSAKKLRGMSEDELLASAEKRLFKAIKTGTSTIEIKSGYGLDTASELKMLRVIRRLKKRMHKNSVPIIIKSTFLGAHAIPPEYKSDRKGYIDCIRNEMLPEISKEGLADFIDVFCESNYFTVDEMLEILEAGKNCGLKPKVHVNQFNTIGGVETAVQSGAVSVDHLEVMKDTDFIALAGNSTIATALPSCSFFLGLDYAPIREMIEKNIAVALASDFNPGSTPSSNLNFVYALACIKMGLTPEEALNTLTINAAHALELGNLVGSITIGKQANLLFFKDVDSLASIPYSFGENLIEKVMIGGEFVNA